MGPLLADDDAHPGRPAIQLQQPGDVSDPRSLADLPVPVVGRRPGIGWDLADGAGDGVGDLMPTE